MQLGIFGDLVKGALGGFAEKPDVPNAPTLDLQGAQKKSTAGNLAALPGLEDLSSQVNDFNLGERTKQLNTAIPGYSNLMSGASSDIQGWLGGQISPDVASAVRNRSNSRAFAGGYGGSGMGENLTARDLGLTSLDLQKMGVSALPSYLTTAYNIGVPPQYNPMMGFVSPEQQIGVDTFNEQNRYSHDWLVNQLAALPSPEDAAIANDVGQMTDTVASMIPAFGAFYSAAGQGGGGGGGGGIMGGSGGGGGMNIGSIMSMLG